MPKITDPAALAELNAPSPRVFGAPDPFKVEDQAIQRRNAEIAARSADRQDANAANQIADNAANRNLAERKLAFEMEQSKSKNNLSPKERADAIAGYNAGNELDKIIAEMETLFKAGPGSTSGLGGVADYLPLTQNQRFDAAGNAARGFVGTALGFTGGQLNSVQEAQMAVGPFLPQSGDRDATILDKIERLKQLANASRDRSTALLGGAPDALGRISDFANPQTGETQSSTKVGNTFKASAPSTLATGQTADVPIPPEMQAEYDQFVASNRGRISPEDYAQFRIEQNQKYGFGFNPGDVQKYIQEGQRINNPRNNINTNIPSPKREIGALEGGLTSAASTGPGASALTYLNSAGFGIPGALAGNEKIDAIQNQSPTGSFIGNLAGGLTGTAALTKGALALGAKSLPNALTGANLAYGGAVGAANDTENPLLGAATGLGVATLGQGAGQFVLGPALGRLATSGSANRARGIFGRRALSRPPTLSGSERSLSNAIGNDGRAISQTLSDANSLGVPITLADTNSALRSLGGAAARRSTDAKALAEGVFEPRQIGQIDRLQAALNRDLGPGGNIPQMSDELLKKARADSKPLYQAAYSAPGASSLDASGVLGTPTGKEALKKAYRAILDDQGDPAALGFDLDQAGEVILTKTPSFQALDYVKRSFDDIAQSGERNPLTGAPIGNQAQTSAGNSARELRAAIDAVNPDYAAARAAYAGPVGEREALIAGKRFGSMTPDEMSFAFDALSPSKQAQFRLGARSQISNQADNVRFASNPFDKVLGTPAAQQKISTLFPGGADNLIRQSELEKMLAKSNNQILGNSMTAERKVADDAFNISPATALAIDGATAVTTGAGGMATAGRLLGGLSKDSLMMGIGKKKANELGAILFDQQNAAKALKDVSVKKRQSGILGKRARRRNRTAGGAVGAALSTPLISDN